jgi:hypothetical protein
MTKLTTSLFGIAALVILFTSFASADEVAGKIGYMSGGLIARHADGTFKIMGPKSEVKTGDNLETAENSFAQVLMNDGTKMTLRPNSNVKIEEYHFKKETPTEDNAVLHLLKGGFRTVSGLISKRGNFDAYKLRAMTATIGVRGTDFTTRLCADQDCVEDSSAAKPKPVNAIGRVMLIQGELTAKDHSGTSRKLFVGSSVFEDEILTTAKDSNAVVAFRDEGRVSLQEETIFHVEKFQFERKKMQEPTQENALFRLLKGSVRVVTGLVGRVKHDNYQFKMTTATIGVRGTGFDAWCNAACATGGNPGATQEDPLKGAGVYVWAGQVALNTPTASQLVSVGQAAILSREIKPVSVTNIPASISQNKAIRPDSVNVDMQKTFGNEMPPEAAPKPNEPVPASKNNDGSSKANPPAEGENKAEPGVYVTVHDGQIVMTQNDGQKLDVSKGQTGFANPTMITKMPMTPSFMSGDKQIDSSDTGSGVTNKSTNAPPQNGCQVK